MKKRVVLWMIAAICLVACLAVAASADAPTAEVVGHNLALKDNVYIVYYVDFQNIPQGAETGVLIWTDPQASYTYGKQEALCLKDLPYGNYETYYYTGVSAKMMAQDIYAVPYVKVGGAITYGSPDVYSVRKYADNKKGSNTMVLGGTITLGDLLVKLLDYGTAAQQYQGYRLDKLANAGYAPHVHHWDSGVVTLEATTTTAGEKTYTCTVCGETKTESIPKIGDIVVRDFGGADYTILCNSFTDYEFNGSLAGDIVQYAVAERNYEVEKNFNVKLNIQSQKGGWGERKNFTAAVRAEKMGGGVDGYDLIATHSVYLGWMSIEGLGKDMAKYSNYIHFAQPWWNQNIYDELNVKGHVFMMIGDITYTLYEYINVMFVNETQFENYFSDQGGVATLYDLVDAGKWTWEKLWEYAGAFGTGATGDGKYGIRTNTHAWRASFVSQDAHLFFRDESGKFYLNNSLGRKENNIVEDMVEHYSKENLEFVVNFLDSTYADVFNPEFLAGNILFYPQTLGEAQTLFGKATEDFGIVPLPKYNADQEMYKTQCRDTVTAVMIMCTTKDEEKAAIVTEGMAKYGHDIIVPAYYERSLVNRYLDKYTDILDTIRAGLTYQPGDAYIQSASGDYGTMRWDIFHLIASGQSEVAPDIHYASKIATAQNELKTFYSKLEKLGITY